MKQFHLNVKTIGKKFSAKKQQFSTTMLSTENPCWDDILHYCKVFSSLEEIEILTDKALLYTASHQIKNFIKNDVLPHGGGWMV